MSKELIHRIHKLLSERNVIMNTAFIYGILTSSRPTKYLEFPISSLLKGSIYSIGYLIGTELVYHAIDPEYRSIITFLLLLSIIRFLTSNTKYIRRIQ